MHGNFDIIKRSTPKLNTLKPGIFHPILAYLVSQGESFGEFQGKRNK